MVYCKHCCKNVAGMRPDDSYLCCNLCGKVIEDVHFSQEPTFFKDSSGQSRLSGNLLRTVESEYGVSRQRTLDRAYDEMRFISYSLGVEDINIVNQALAFYRIALERNFTKGRKSEQVHAACLYIAFRENNKPYLLIDFSVHLHTNVYVLGAVFLQLCKVLRLEEHPIVQKPVDPSLFIFKYTNNLLKERNTAVTETALSIIASMKRDWIQTGRKPSGLCGAALYISALAHGHKFTKSDILRIVHVCEATLTKRLVEFENTESGSLTVEELNQMAREREKDTIEKPNTYMKKTDSKDLLCEHKGSGVLYFAHGLCQACYKDLIKLSGGFDGGLDPPAFQRAEKERLKKSSTCGSANGSDDVVNPDGVCTGKDGELLNSEPKCTGAGTEPSVTEDCAHDNLDKDESISNELNGESETLSDIDDAEVNEYLHNEEEKYYKKIIWEEMNREYLEEQAAKEAAAAAAKEAFEASSLNCSGDVQRARDIAAAAAAEVAKSRKEKLQKRVEEAKKLGPARDAAEATLRMMGQKRLSSKINYDNVKKLFDESTIAENPKKMRVESDNDDHGSMKDEHDKAHKTEVKTVDEFEDGNDLGAVYEDTLYENEEGYKNDDGDEYGYDGF